MNKTLIVSLLCILSAVTSFAQSEQLFNDNRLSSVYISIPPDSLEQLYDSVLSDHYYLARFIFDDGEYRDTLDRIGFRLRGNTSRYSAKKSFKISFNTYVPGRKYQGVKKINLNGEHNDPTMIREKLYYDLWNRAGMAPRRTAFVRVYINQVYYGLYTNLEEMDKDWLERVFPDKSGNLYKCTYPANLVYLGTNQQTYKNLENSTVTGGRVYDLQTNETQDDYTRLVELITVLNQQPDSIFAQKIKDIFEVDHFLKALALDVATGNWDDYSYNKNNFYLYDDPHVKKFDFITYDPDNTFGIDWFGIDWANRDCRDWINEGIALPLAQKLLAVPGFFTQYTAFLDSMATKIIQPETVFPRIDSLKNLIQQAAIEDTYRTLDYGYTVADFNNAFIMALEDHVTWGLKPFISQRKESILNQLAPHGIAQERSGTADMKLFPNPVNETLNVMCSGCGSESSTVTILDLYGRTLSKHTIPSKEILKIEVGQLLPGIYAVQHEMPGRLKMVRPFIKL